MAGDMSGLNAVYYATLLLVGAGLTALLGYEIGWLAAHSSVSLAVAAVLAPFAVLAAWTVSE
jgi:hypothetical protein